VVKIKCGVGNQETPINAAFLALYATFFTWPHIQYGWKQAIPREPSARFLGRLFSALAAHSVSGLSYPVLWSSGLPTGPLLSPVYHARASKRYYGLMRQSDGLRPAWLPSLLWPVFALAGCPSDLPFFALSLFAHMPRPLPRWRPGFC